ncbi:MAG: hypothetical protein V2B18_24575, partial [Pseudomonadota bacterium]
LRIAPLVVGHCSCPGLLEKQGRPAVALVFQEAWGWNRRPTTNGAIRKNLIISGIGRVQSRADPRSRLQGVTIAVMLQDCFQRSILVSPADRSSANRSQSRLNLPSSNAITEQ